ncbi:ester cyclase [Pokkaliibacter sp. CJK22405]|uniref:ester cyclase n=1 Tax=Pokkaliibacter sp. CJK22405 TaxID=3384615 RepID=UPI00398483E1
MTREELIHAYRSYIACLNHQDWENLYRFVDEDVIYNGERIGLSGYREMLEADFKAIPDLAFTISHLASDPPTIAASLHFDCTPRGELFQIPVNGTRVQFIENVLYEFNEGRIARVCSVIDKEAIRQQL